MQVVPWFYKKRSSSGPIPPTAWADFDGDSGYVSSLVAAGPPGGYPWSVECWAVTPPAGATRALCGMSATGSNDIYTLMYFQSDGALIVNRRLVTNNDTVSVLPGLSAGWHHFKLELRSDQAFAFILDGVETLYDFQTPIDTTTNPQLMAGVLRTFSPTGYFVGDLAQVKLTYNSGLQVDWPLAVDALDYSGNGNTGTITPTVIFES